MSPTAVTSGTVYETVWVRGSSHLDAAPTEGRHPVKSVDTLAVVVGNSVNRLGVKPRGIHLVQPVNDASGLADCEVPVRRPAS